MGENQSGDGLDFTPEEEAMAEEEALAFVYGVGVGGAFGMGGDPLASEEGMAMFLAKKEEVLRMLRDKRSADGGL